MVFGKPSLFAFGALIYDNFHQGRTTMHHHKDLRLAPSETKRLFPLQALRGFGLVVAEPLTW